MGRVYERERGRAERNSRAPPAGMHGGSPPHRARHGQGCAVGSGEESELDLDLRRSAAGSGSAWSSTRKSWGRGDGRRQDEAEEGIRPATGDRFVGESVPSDFWAQRSVTSGDEFSYTITKFSVGSWSTCHRAVTQTYL